jgi:hypothetical protein
VEVRWVTLISITENRVRFQSGVVLYDLEKPNSDFAVALGVPSCGQQVGRILLIEFFTD